MLRSFVRRIGASLLAAALALPLAVAAQAPSATAPAPPKGLAADDAQRSNHPPPPITAPTGKVPVNPERGMKPEKSTATGSTAIPGWNRPPASWAAPSRTPQYASLPGRETNILVQVTGREWRELHNGPLTRYGGWIPPLVLGAIMLFYLLKGPIRLHGKPTGRLIERFNAVERASHWTMAITFVLLALSGTVMLWGKYLILPWLGYTGFSGLVTVAKTLHNFVGPLFIASMAVSFVLFVKDNRVRAHDVKWLLRLGGMFGKGGEVPSGRFNGGEKAWFWGGMVLLGAVVSVTGLILDFPNWNQGREMMQLANLVHGAGAILFIAGAFAHIYIGTIGMEGAYRAMRRGYVDEEWAREHHALWYEDVKRGERSVQTSPAKWQPGSAD
jgi:formate dehydrogenase subunit gamma